MTRRRAKGEGSVYRCKDGRCIGEYEDAYGKRRYISGKTRVEVRAKLRKLLSDQDEGIAFDSKNLTLEPTWKAGSTSYGLRCGNPLGSGTKCSPALT
jgi:hypothetical protein